jgi:hypothetical protein
MKKSEEGMLSSYEMRYGAASLRLEAAELVFFARTLQPLRPLEFRE